MDAAAPKPTTKELTTDGYTYTVDTDLLDDVEAFELIDQIENRGKTAAIVPLLTFLIGKKGYDEMKAFYTKQDADEHKDAPEYKGRFRMAKLSRVYATIVENFDPKD